MRRYGFKPARASATGRFGTVLLATCLALLPYSQAFAGGPTGGSVAAGSATITNPAVNNTTINQTSEKVIINWQDFSIPSDASVLFNQPDAKAIALNRVTGGGASAIDGALTANGNVWIINPNGILFGQGSNINVGSLIATTSDISDSDFMNGQYNFTKAGNPNAAIGNEGTIKAASGGSIVLAGPVVSNGGLIEADLGTATLAGTEAFTVDFQGDNLIRFTMAAPQTSANPQQLAVSNSGKISANGGHVVMTVRAAESVANGVINNTGMVEATSVHDENGTIVLDAGDGQANVSGTLDASGKDAGQTGGTINVTGNAVNVADNTNIDASGSAGGGAIAVGGNPHGAGPLPNAQTTSVGKATLVADATDNGNGGTISVWSDNSTQFSGSASARGAGTGNGGFVETSGGTLNIADGAHVNTSAPKGLAGNWLIDPAVANISVENSGGTISPATIESELGTNSSNGSNVTLSTSGGSITVYDPITYTSTNTLNLLAGGDIYAAADIQNGGTGNINLIAGWDGTTTNPAQFGNSGVYGNNGGSVYVTSDYDLDPDEAYESEAEEGEAHEVAIGSAGGITTVGGDNIEVLGSFGPSQIGYRSASGGGVDINAVGDVTLTGGSCSYCYAQIGSGGIGYNGESATFTNGNATGDVSLHAGGDVTLTSGSSVYSYAQIGNGGDTSTGNASGDVLVDTGGAVNLYGDGDYAQIGNGGWAVSGNSSGMVTVDAVGDVTLTGGSATPYGYTQIGNGGQSSHGNSSGDIHVYTGGALTLTSESDGNNYALIGNGGFANIGGGISGNAGGNVIVSAQDNLQFNVCGNENCEAQGTVWIGNAAPNGVVSGDLTIIAADQKDNCGNADCGADVGNMVRSALGDDSDGNYVAGAGGNVTVAYANPTHNDAPMFNIDAGAIYDSPFDLTLISGNNINVSGSLQNAGTGDLTLVSGWNSSVVTPEDIVTQADSNSSMAALFAANAAAYGANGGNIQIGGADSCQETKGVCGSAAGSAGGTTSVLGDDITVEADNGYAQIGYNGAGGGDIRVYAANDVTITGNNGELAVIGNGASDAAGDVTGNIDVRAGGQLQLYSYNDGTSWIGNTTLSAGNIETGNVNVIAGSEEDNFDIGTIIMSDLGDDSDGNYIAGAGGNVTFGFTNPGGDQKINNGAEFDSPHTLSILSALGMNISGSLLNDGSGAIDLVAGWNPVNVTPDQVAAATDGTNGAMAALFAAHANGYGNSAGTTVTIGDPAIVEDPSVGSAGGTTTVFTNNLTLEANNAVAQLGHPDGNGDVTVYAKGTVTLDGSSNTALAEIGNGTTASPGGGNVTINAQALSVNQYNAVLGDTASFAISGTGAVGSAGAPLRLWVDDFSIVTNGGNMFASAPGGAVSIGVGTSGVNLGGGALTLSAAGDVSQTQKIVASALYVSSSGGAITLSNAGNAFATLSASTSGGSTATITDSTGVTVASANIGGTFALTSAGAIGQTGAIVANALNVTSTGGAITLTHSGNSFAALIISTGGNYDANVNDSTGVTVASANAGGAFTLSSGGAIGQTGAITANALNVSSTGGAVTLTNSSNAFNTLTATASASYNANINDSSAVTVTSAHVGGTFTLTSASSIGQSGAIIAGALDVSSTGSTITLDNSGNAFGMLTASTSGSNDADIYDTSAVTVASAHIGGTFTLASGGAIGQSGAIIANALNASSTGGAITLTNSSNAFDTLTIATSASYNANINDSSAVTVASVHVGGTLTLTSGGAIGQSGAIVSGGLGATSTGGTITLDNVSNAFSTLAVSTGSSNGADIHDSTGVSVTSAHVGGTFTLTAAGAIAQSGAIVANAFDVSSSGGAITLTDAGNSFATLTVSTASYDADIADSTGVTVASANVGGTFTLSSGGAVGQTSAITANALNMSSTGGAITLDNSDNAFTTLTVSTGGNSNADIYDSFAVTVALAHVGGTFTLTSADTIGQSGVIAANALDVSSTGNAITLDNSGNAFNTLTVSTGASNNADIHDSSAVTVASAHVGGTFTLASGGAIGQSGAITANALNVSSTGGAITLGNSSNAFNTLTVATSDSDNADVYDSLAVTIASAQVGGMFTLTSAGSIGQSGAIVAGALDVSSTSGAITLTNSGNAFGTLTVSTGGSNDADIYDSSAVTVASANAGGTFTLASGGAIGQSGAIIANALDVSSTGGAIMLGNSGNAFGTLAVATGASYDASIDDLSAVTVSSANVGGTFALSSGGAIGQSGAITASALDVSSTGGAIALDNSGNQFATLSVSTSLSNDANINDSATITVASANVGGTFALTSAGAIGQSGSITASIFNVSSTGGSITLDNSGNRFGTLSVSASAGHDANINDASAVTLALANVGGTFTLSSGGAIGQSGAIVAGALDVSSTGGAITLTNAANAFGTLSAAASGDANVDDSTALTVSSANIGGALTLTAGGALNQSGAIVADALNVSGGGIVLNNSGNGFATLSVTTAGSSDASVTDSTSVTVASAHVGGTFTLASGGTIGQNDPIIADALDVSANGAITLDDPGNAFNTLTIAAGANSATVYDTSSLVVASAAADGSITLLSKGNLTFASSVQVANGNLLAVAGWDGTTVSPASLVAGNAYGNNGGNIIIGGADAAGGVAIGASGTATLAGNNLTLAAVNGYAQLGTHGSGAGALAVVAKDNVALNAGSAAGDYAQIGNGGYQTSGSNSGAIAVTAAGGVTLAGGSGSDAYAQIGHGGAESNANSSGYGDAGAIAVNAASVTLSSGSGSAAYAEIGNGGYRVGAGLTGTANIGGTINVASTSTVNIDSGSGGNAYAQIGNGGGFANTNATASAHGTTSGDVTVTAPPAPAGTVNVVAGTGTNAYAQIGNGGYSSNSPSAAPHANFVINGNVTVSDLLLQGGDGGAFAYSQIGNGGLGNSGLADVSGNIDIITNGGTITLVPGTAQGSSTEIGNDIGTGAVSGSITGYVPPLSEANGTIASLSSNPPPTVPTGTPSNTLVIDDQQTQTVTIAPEQGNEPGPLEDLTGNSGSGQQESSDKSDQAADAVADSLDGAAKKSASEVYFGGLVTKLQPLPASATPHGVPPADADFSSWGNEAFWQ